MDNIKWSEWESVGPGYLHDKAEGRYSLEPIEAWVWRGDQAEKSTGVVHEFRAYVNGKEDPEVYTLVFHPGCSTNPPMFTGYRSRATMEHEVFGLTELECMERVKVLRNQYMARKAQEYKTACELYTKIVADISRMPPCS